MERDVSEMIGTKVKSMDYRTRVYERYISTHLTSTQDISIEAFDRQLSAFKGYFGSFLPKDKDAIILDIGCGHGSFLYFLRKQGYTNAYGVDISTEQVEAAQKFGLANVHCGDLMEFLQKHPREFDCITALDVIEHFPKEEILPLLDAVYQALKPGGTFMLQSPNADGPFGSRYRYWDFSHEVAFTKTSISQALSVAGFTNILVCPTGPVVHGLLSASRWVLWQTIRLLLQLYLLAETGSLRGHILTQNLIAIARK
jgi:2-polyprenyl-3-methyl-5-hydroxy-6-metoxy-1,4-benzoquinol methylase